MLIQRDFSVRFRFGTCPTFLLEEQACHPLQMYKRQLRFLFQTKDAMT